MSDTSDFNTPSAGAGQSGSRSAGSQPVRRFVVGGGNAPSSEASQLLGRTGRYVALSMDSVDTPHCIIDYVDRSDIRVVPVNGCKVEVTAGNGSTRLVDKDGVNVTISDSLRLGGQSVTVKKLLIIGQQSRSPGGLSRLVPADSRVIRDFGGEIEGKYEPLHEMALGLRLEQYERESLAFARPSGASDTRVTVFHDVNNSGIARQRIKELEKAGYQVSRRAAEPRVLVQIRDNIPDDTVRPDREQESKLYNDFCDLVSQAIQKKASDIHIECREKKAWVRWRVNGQLRTKETFTAEYAHRLVSAVYNRQAEGGDSAFTPTQIQQGEIQDVFGGTKAGLRIQVNPCAPRGSFDFVTRILEYDAEGEVLGYEEMGYHPDQAKRLRRAAAKPYGAMVLCGTTGSGKSTTLYNVIRGRLEFFQGSKKCITNEEPVERLFPIIGDAPGGTQVEINRSAQDGKDHEDSGFAMAISAAMRSDPDIMMIGEVRDRDTALLFQRATMSGHQVYTTTHTGDPFEVVSRFIDLGISRHVMTAFGFINALVHQRLVPMQCPHCSINIDEFEQQHEGSDVFSSFLSRVRLFFDGHLEKIRFRGPGCNHCEGDSVVGRTVCASVVEIDDDMRPLLLPEHLGDARRLWIEDGNLTSFGHAVIKCLEGTLSPDDLEGEVDAIPEQSLEAVFGDAHLVTRFARGEESGHVAG